MRLAIILTGALLAIGGRDALAKKPANDGKPSWREQICMRDGDPACSSSEAEAAICARDGDPACSAAEKARIKKNGEDYAKSQMKAMRKIACIVPELTLSEAADPRQRWRETSVSFVAAAKAAGYENPRKFFVDLKKHPKFGCAVGGADPPPDNTADGRIWQRAGVFVWQTADYNPEAFGAKLDGLKYGWAAVAIHDLERNQANMDAGWADKLRGAAQGRVLVGGWAYVAADPEADAAKYVALCKKWKLDFFIANAEAEYKSDTGGLYDRSERFVKAYRALAPNYPSALSSFGFLGDYSRMGSDEDRKGMRVFDFAAWRDGGFRWMPQVYWHEFEDYEPYRAIQWAIEAKGWPKGWVHPTIGLYGARKHDVHEYVAKLKAATARYGTKGVSVYLANQMTDAEYQAIAAAIGPGGIAK